MCDRLERQPSPKTKVLSPVDEDNEVEVVAFDGEIVYVNISCLEPIE
jgi:hypothetical protein